MKTYFKCNGMTIVFAGLLFLVGCSNVLDSQKEQKTAGGEGFFILNIGEANTGKTIQPTTVLNDFAGFTLIFSTSSNEDVIVERTNSNLNQIIRLPVATWDLTVTAYMDTEKTEPAAQGSLAGIEISEGSTTNASLKLRPIIETGATGMFRWNIEYPADVTIANITITPLAENSETVEQILYFTGGNPAVNKDNSSSPLVLDTGYYSVVLSLSIGERSTGREEYLHIYQNMESFFEYIFTYDHFAIYSVTNDTDNGPGTLRYAITNAAANSTIYIESGVGTIQLENSIEISKNLTIQGNGVVLTRSTNWSTVDDTSQFLFISSSNAVVNISRIHFKDGKATAQGAAIRNHGVLILESCIFNNNQTTSTNAQSGGAIYSNYNLNVKGCTFYSNSAYQGGAIFINNGSLNLTGNVFNTNTATNAGPVVYRRSGTVTSDGFNVVNTALGTNNNQSGWIGKSTDINIINLPFSPMTFQLHSASRAVHVIATLPSGYPTADFYGTPISNGASVGAVQGVFSGSGYYVDVTVNNLERGTVTISAIRNQDGLCTGSITLTANAFGNNRLVYWLRAENNVGSTNPLQFTLTGYTNVHAVFEGYSLVTNFTDDNTLGTLRYALNNVVNGDIIRFYGVTPGDTTIQLTSALPKINCSINIEGNGVTLTRSASWTTQYQEILNIYSSTATVSISRIHFKNGYSTSVNGFGAAISNSGNLTLESCIFSNNRDDFGGAIYSSTVDTNISLTIRGCTFYGNTGYAGLAIYAQVYFPDIIQKITLAGNLFYGNKTTNWGALMNMRTDSKNFVVSATYNVIDVPYGSGTVNGTTGNPSGWVAGTGDTTFSALSISGVPINTTTFAPLSSALNIVPSGLPTIDFYGNTRSFPTAPGAVKY